MSTSNVPHHHLFLYSKILMMCITFQLIPRKSEINTINAQETIKCKSKKEQLVVHKIIYVKVAKLSWPARMGQIHKNSLEDAVFVTMIYAKSALMTH